LNLDNSRRFYREVLGLDVVSPSPSVKPSYIKHPSTPWYVVSLQRPPEMREPLTRFQRFALQVESPAALAEAHRGLKEHGEQLGVTELEEIKETGDSVSFMFSDPDRNWWEVRSSVCID
jgi:catechol 2,3-dioxygenase-like lactoylglutathione lyase family enzyme